MAGVQVPGRMFGRDARGYRIGFISVVGMGIGFVWQI